VLHREDIPAGSTFIEGDPARFETTRRISSSWQSSSFRQQGAPIDADQPANCPF
jgi:hypothetical protein